MAARSANRQRGPGLAHRLCDRQELAKKIIVAAAARAEKLMYPDNQYSELQTRLDMTGYRIEFVAKLKPCTLRRRYAVRKKVGNRRHTPIHQAILDSPGGVCYDGAIANRELKTVDAAGLRVSAAPFSGKALERDWSGRDHDIVALAHELNR